LRTIDGFRFEAVACLLDLQPAAARKRYGRALLRLRDKLVEAGVLDRGS
jgi:DNA-directed RNA polymerase specialized sigma24 family protein